MVEPIVSEKFLGPSTHAEHLGKPWMRGTEETPERGSCGVACGTMHIGERRGVRGWASGKSGQWIQQSPNGDWGRMASGTIEWG